TDITNRPGSRILSFTLRREKPEDARKIRNWQTTASKAASLAKERSGLEAVTEVEKAATMAAELFGDDHFTRGYLLRQLGGLYVKAGRYAKAETPLVTSLKVLQRWSEPDDDATETLLHEIGGVYLELYQWDQAEDHLQKSLKLAEQRVGARPEDVAAVLNSLGLLNARRGNWEKAEGLLKRSVAILENRLGHEA